MRFTLDATDSSVSDGFHIRLNYVYGQINRQRTKGISSLLTERPAKWQNCPHLLLEQEAWVQFNKICSTGSAKSVRIVLKVL